MLNEVAFASQLRSTRLFLSSNCRVLNLYRYSVPCDIIFCSQHVRPQVWGRDIDKSGERQRQKERARLQAIGCLSLSAR